jgi:diadenosine tetraphosphate (Ap4A) HIT family hydrolase
MSGDFLLHPQLAADCHHFGRLGDARLLLHRNAMLPWFILVPETDQQELLELPAKTQAALLADCSRLGAFVKSHFGCPKLNFGAIGNLVPQLHLHVIGRRPGDACWPAPVWGHLQRSEAYSENELDVLQARATAELGL